MFRANLYIKAKKYEKLKMIRGIEENNIVLPIFNRREFNKIDFENKFKTKQSAFKIVSRIDRVKVVHKKVFEIKKMSKLDLKKYNIDFKKDQNVVDKLFEYKNMSFKGKRFII